MANVSHVAMQGPPAFFELKAGDASRSCLPACHRSAKPPAMLARWRRTSEDAAEP